jgi:DNA-3-methyladenine glycosylase
MARAALKSTGNGAPFSTTHSSTAHPSTTSRRASQPLSEPRGPIANPVAKTIPRRIRRLRRSELPSDTAALAVYLIGKTLVIDHPEGRMSGRIVETEAYVVGDAACHAFRGQTPRNRSLFLDRGHAYVYFTYGSCFMLNVTGETPGVGAGVLVRAIEPLEGLAAMRRRRSVARLYDLTRGPGRLAAALEIDKRYDGADLCGKGPLWLGEAVRPAGQIGVSTRIGLTQEVHRRLRFYERDNGHVSGPAKLRK